MNTHLPAPSAIRGLCGAFFLAGAASAGDAIFATAATWSRPEIMASVEITSPSLAGWALFGLAMAIVGVRLLYDRPHSVLHGLIAAWLIVAVRGYGVARLVWLAITLKGITISPAWVSHWFLWALPGLFAGVVVWLLHTLRSRPDRDVSILGAPQAA